MILRYCIRVRYTIVCINALCVRSLTRAFRVINELPQGAAKQSRIRAYGRSGVRLEGGKIIKRDSEENRYCNAERPYPIYTSITRVYTCIYTQNGRRNATIIFSGNNNNMCVCIYTYRCISILLPAIFRKPLFRWNRYRVEHHFIL